jgi:hypothetical protein
MHKKFARGRFERIEPAGTFMECLVRAIVFEVHGD